MQWPWSKQRRRSESLGIAIEFGQCAAVHLKMGELVNAFPAKGAQAGLDELETWLAQKKLKGVPQYWILGRDDYRLHLTDAPAVTDDELASALKYRICEQQGLAPEKQAVQAIRLPREAYHARQSMAYAASTDEARIRTLVDWSHEQGLALSGISIREMAMLPMLRLMQPETSVAVLEVAEDKGYLSLYASGALCLNREIHIDRKRLVDALLKPDPQSDLPSQWAQPLANPPEPLASDTKQKPGPKAPVAKAALALEPEPGANQDAGPPHDHHSGWGRGFSASVEEAETASDSGLSAEYGATEDGPPTASSASSGADSDSSFVLDTLALEIQRSLDYYDSQLGLGVIGQLWVMNQPGVTVDRLQASLQARISPPVQPLSVHYFHADDVASLPDSDLLCYAWGGAILANEGGPGSANRSNSSANRVSV